MSLHTSENVRCFFECERMNFSIFWHHHEQSPHLTSGYILKLTSNHKFSINHAVSWNLVLFSLIHFGHFPKITWTISDIFSLWDIFVWLKMALWPNWLKFLWSFQNKFGLWPTNPRKKLETQSREMFLIFRATPLVVHCMVVVSLVATALYFIQSEPCFSTNWFNLV